MKKISKKMTRWIVLFLLGYLVLRYYQPGLVKPYEQRLIYQLGLDRYSRVLGASQVNLVKSTGNKIYNIVSSWPVVRHMSKTATGWINEEMEKVKKIPEQEADKIKEDVREKVCEEWLTE